MRRRMMTFEHEFFKVAACWLRIRGIMLRRIRVRARTRSTPVECMIGELDQTAEMALILKEWRKQCVS